MARPGSLGFQENMTDLKEKLAEIDQLLKSNLKNKIIETQRKIEEKVEEKPLQSVATAFGAGVVLGALGYALIRRR